MANRKPIRWRVVLALYQQQDGKCFYCCLGCDADDFEIDHKVPVSDGGSDDPSNLALACVDCNRGKGRSDWRLYRLYCQWYKLAHADMPFRQFRHEYYSSKPPSVFNVSGWQFELGDIQRLAAYV